MRSIHLFTIAITLLSCVLTHSQERPQTAVFNFSMESGGDSNWQWLEKGLADMLTNDLITVKYPVVARDEMQAVAMITGWDEFKELSEKMKGAPLLEIKKAIKIEKLISGSFRIENDQIQITTQIVDPDSGNLLHEINVEGKVDQVFTIRQNLTKQLIPWLNKSLKEVDQKLIFSKRPAPWSENVDAMRALYEGIDLFDQGNYPEAWLKFRQAERASPGFADAKYWAARMDYFQTRYEHSRYVFEDFLNNHPTHPRIGSAIREYMHSLENSDADPDQLLELYDHMAEVYPDAEQIVGTDIYPNHRWSKWRAMQFQAGRGNLEQALKQTPEKGGLYEWWVQPEQWRLTHLLKYLESEGRDASIIDTAKSHSKVCKLLEFEPGQTTLIDPAHPSGKGVSLNYLLLPPKGKLFKSMRVWPLASKGDNTVLNTTVSQSRYRDVYSSGFSSQLRDTRETGCQINELAKVSAVNLRMVLVAMKKYPPDNPLASIEGAKIEAVFEDIPKSWGTLNIECYNCIDFTVKAGGDFLRSGAGEVRYLKPGKYILNFIPRVINRQELDHFREFTKEVEIRANETTSIGVGFPWADPSRWQGWQAAKVKIDESHKLELDLRILNPKSPQFVFSEEKIRLIWCNGGNLWTSESDDGLSFYNTRKLELPVSSAWNEVWMRCKVSPTGKYVLTFLSNRNKDRTYLLYSCWSRDFVNWTAPKQVLNEFVHTYDLAIDPSTNSLIIAETSGGKQVSIWTSTDALHWQKTKTLEFDSDIWAVSLLPPNNRGEFELFTSQKGGDKYVDRANRIWNFEKHINRWLSRDLKAWKRDESFVYDKQNRYENDTLFASRRPDGSTLLVSCTPFASSNRGTVISFNQEGESSKKSYRNIILKADATIDYHPKWGACMCWFRTLLPGSCSNRDFIAPIVLRGPTFDPIIKN